MASKDLPTARPQEQPDVTLIGLVGGPGFGKSTQCALLAKGLPIIHLSVGDTLRAEMNKPGSLYAEIIRANMSAGRVGPPELTTRLLRQRMEIAIRTQGIRTFILDGFPRNLEQCEYLEKMITPIQRLIVLDCSDEILFERLSTADRNRFDDQDETMVRKRLATFGETTSEVMKSFEARGAAEHINGEQDLDAVAERMRSIVNGVLCAKS
ncbi:Putative adenylate kinase/UMP-CMP kinase, P-loop containing nucleoside triphosphate hydrolase [Septoria linicola]|uniref:Adenylate kinase/UMP-CMP kinase, P-loop containing nucleoside triphosphate hydrolase n=1 Tax=Septoria linicola TaxID=215465 RepID=A0A9Q9AXC4_9PEZI|nr:putative adenylate kinase/UMP-CMP kinase, P-loop containing nucleoside triphosphate hydrolase [Septoria linicola]USW53541.1 Putative adenylate kinase/UMP-CMP kinase, P-loop containing nucleoside triphosphate hydrolase [Septoria linicola]